MEPVRTARRSWATRALLSVLILVLSLCVAHAETGIAAFYGVGRTASGEVSGPNGLNAAHRILPLGRRSLLQTCATAGPSSVRLTPTLRSYPVEKIDQVCARSFGQRPISQGGRVQTSTTARHSTLCISRKARRADA